MNKATFRDLSVDRVNIPPVKNKVLSPIKHYHLGFRLDNIYGDTLLEKELRENIFIEAISKKHPNIYRLWLISSDCGRSVKRWGALVVFLVFFFAFAYTCIGVDGFIINEKLNEFKGSVIGTFGMFTYYSVVTLTTLGFGDITPKDSLAMIFVVLEVFVGYLALGALITLFANKLGR
jgi:hypothetical protein